MSAMSKLSHVQQNWRRICAAVVVMCMILAGLITAFHTENVGDASSDDTIIAFDGVGLGDQSAPEKIVLTQSDCGLHCNQHSPMLSKVPEGPISADPEAERLCAANDLGLYAAPLWGVLEPPRV
ncbi:hypothetical protein [Ferrovibrio sp.]|uniref:hypothetical protein n=1 Tax=Ferrovibrio sp. TaxID=1917215 RepID=UPI00311F4497